MSYCCSLDMVCCTWSPPYAINTVSLPYSFFTYSCIPLLSAIITSAYFMAIASEYLRNFLANFPHLARLCSIPSIFIINCLWHNIRKKGKKIHPDTPKTKIVS